MTDQLDKMNCRCPRLGGPVTFDYCRRHAVETGPCWKIFDCWWETFDVVGELTREMGEDAVNRIANTRPPSKTASLVTLIQQAQKRCTEDSS